jgi:peptidyl-prolyl cis-trans isomerase B (cyclophilin B)
MNDLAVHEIDGRYIFATESSASKNDLIFSIGDNTGDSIADNTEIKNTEEGGGCLIATAAFDSELSSQVQFLREIRDNTVLQTESGTSFMAGFNQFYYSFSPTIADYERENPAFKEVVKLSLTPLLTSLTLLQYVDIDSESEMLGYGIGIILLNIGMYFVAPAILIMKVKKII